MKNEKTDISKIEESIEESVTQKIKSKEDQKRLENKTKQLKKDQLEKNDREEKELFEKAAENISILLESPSFVKFSEKTKIDLGKEYPGISKKDDGFVLPLSLLELKVTSVSYGGMTDDPDSYFHYKFNFVMMFGLQSKTIYIFNPSKRLGGTWFSIPRVRVGLSLSYSEIGGSTGYDEGDVEKKIETYFLGGLKELADSPENALEFFKRKHKLIEVLAKK